MARGVRRAGCRGLLRPTLYRARSPDVPLRSKSTSPGMTGRVLSGDLSDVRQNPDRQSRRDRAPGAARLQGARDRHRRGPLDRGRRRDACAARRRERLHRTAAGARQLSQRPGAAHRLRDHRRERRAPRVRVSLRERALCRNPRRASDRIHRPARGAHPPDGRQDRGKTHRQAARHPGRARLGGRRVLRRGGARRLRATSGSPSW